jgi:hypothetical protein
MQTVLPFHIVAGVLGLVFGAAEMALWDGPDARKRFLLGGTIAKDGAPTRLHR